MIFDHEFETMPEVELEELLCKRRVSLIGRVYEKFPYYLEQMDTAGLKTSNITGTADLHIFEDHFIV